MTTPYMTADFIYMLISFLLTTTAVTRAGILDHENIFSNQTSNYFLLLGGLTLMFTEYIVHPELAIANMIILAVYSTTVSIYTSMTSRRIFGSTDIIFTHMYLFSTPPMIFNNIIIPYSGVVVLFSTFLAIYKIYYKHEIGTPFLTIMSYSHLALSPAFFYSIVIMT